MLMGKPPVGGIRITNSRCSAIRKSCCCCTLSASTVAADEITEKLVDIDWTGADAQFAALF